MIPILTLALGLVVGFVGGLLAARYYVVEPLWGTERGLRKELRKLRGALWAKDVEISNLRTWVALGMALESYPRG